jgi:hypothetical protein
MKLEPVRHCSGINSLSGAFLEQLARIELDSKNVRY